MRILHVINSLHPKYGGPVIGLINLVKSQKKINPSDSINILTSVLDNEEEYYVQKYKKELNSLGIKVLSFKAFTFFRVISNIYKVCNLITKNDVLHIHGLYRFPVILCAITSRIIKKPYIIRTHGSLDPYLKKQSSFGKFGQILKFISENIIETSNLNAAAFIHFTSEEESLLAKPFHSNLNPMIVPNGVEEPNHNINAIDFHKTLKLPRTMKVILFLGRIHPKKGINLLIEGFKIALKKNKDIALVFVGPDNDNLIDQYISKKDLKNKPIFYLGQIDHDQIGSYFKGADIFALTSYTENFGIAVVEAISYGCPVLISENINIYKKIKNLGCGYICELSKESISEGIIKAISDKKLQNHLRKIGKYKILETFSWDAISEKIYKFYIKAIRNN